MSKQSQRIIQGLLKLHFNTHFKTQFASNPKPSFNYVHGFSTFLSNGFSDSAVKASKSQPNRVFLSSISRPISSNAVLCPKIGSFRSYSGSPLRNYSMDDLNSSKSLSFGKLLFNPLRIRQFSTGLGGIGRRINGGNVSGNMAKKVVDKPLSLVSSKFSRYKEAIGLQMEGLWKRNYLFVFGAVAVFVCITLWRIMFGIANTFVGLSEGMAKYGFLALSAAMVSFAGLYLRARYTINPDKVYRMAMRELNTSASILEVMGTPLAGTDLRAYVMSGGGFTLTKFKPRFRSKRCFLIFPVRGSEMKGLVSVEAKKSKGKYNMKLLAVDIPMASGPEQRLYLIGDEKEYLVGGGLVNELREPVVKAMAATKELEERDDIEAEEDQQRELQDAEKKQEDEIAKLGKDRTWKWWPKL